MVGIIASVLVGIVWLVVGCLVTGTLAPEGISVDGKNILAAILMGFGVLYILLGWLKMK